MPLPFDDRGLLPPGIHDATLDEIDRVLGRFRKSTRRITLMANLREYVKELGRTGWDFQLLIDGSFVMTAVDEPNDIDAVLILPADWDFAPLSQPSLYNLVAKNSTKKEYKIDLYPVASGSTAESRFLTIFADVRIEWCDLFGWDRPILKGLIRILS